MEPGETDLNFMILILIAAGRVTTPMRPKLFASY